MNLRTWRAALAAATVAALLPAVPAHAASVRYEAEDATILPGTVDSDHANFSGTGFANTDNTLGAYVEWTVAAPSGGTATIELRYSNAGSADRRMDISVDGLVVAADRSFPVTADWDTWASETVTAEVAAGSVTIRATAITGDGAPNLDYLDFEVVPDEIGYQAEDAVISQGSISAEHPGFTGSGFADYDNVVGSYVQWSVASASGGAAVLTFRHANGSTATRTMDISVNGSVVATGLAFDPTGGWDAWADVSLTVDLVPGANTVRATADTGAGGPNVDKLTVSGGDDGGDGWIAYSPTFNVQERGCGQVDGLTFRLTCADGDGEQRAERRYATYYGGSRKFEGHFRITSMGGSRISLKQTFKTTGPYFMLAVENGGRLYIVNGGKTVGTEATIGTTVRLTTIHVVGDSHKVYINGSLRDTVSSPDGDFYDKFGAYRTNSGEGPITVQWSDIGFWYR